MQFRISMYLASFSMLILALTLTLSTNTSFAQEEHLSESHEHETEKAVVTHTEQEEHEQPEEHSSHETAEAKHEIKGELKHEHIHEAVEGSHVHKSTTAEAAQWVGVATLLAVAPVFGIKMRTADKLAYKSAVLILALGVGFMHLLLTPDHLVDVNIEHAIFFATAGFAQIVFGLLFMAKPTRKLTIIGAAGSIGNIVLYFATRIENLPEPFGAPEGIDPVGIIAKIVEMSLAALLIYLSVYLRKAKPVEMAPRS